VPGAPRIELRPLHRDDLDLVERWLRQPHVARWWGDPGDHAAIEAKYGARIDGLDPTSMWVVEVDGRPAGLAQHYLHADHPAHDAAVGIPDAVGIDYLLDVDHAGRGLGPLLLARAPTPPAAG